MVLCNVSVSFGQELGLISIYSGTQYKKLQNSYGYGLEYNQYIKSKNRIGISISQIFHNKRYDDIWSGTGEHYVTRTDPKNRKIALKLNYVFRLINNTKSKLYLGPVISLNYFHIEEQVFRIPTGDITEARYEENYWVNNKIGIGFLLEFELNEFITKNTSAFISINPEINNYSGDFSAKGDNEYSVIPWMNFSLGIRYNFSHSKND